MKIVAPTVVPTGAASTGIATRDVRFVIYAPDAAFPFLRGASSFIFHFAEPAFSPKRDNEH